MIVVVWCTGIADTPSPISIAGFCSPRGKLGVIICYYVTDNVNMLKGSQKMQVGSLKGTALRLCVLSSVICFFPFLKKTIELSNYIMISFRTGPPTENYCLHSQVISSTFQKVLRLIKILARSKETCCIVRSFYN